MNNYKQIQVSSLLQEGILYFNFLDQFEMQILFEVSIKARQK